MIGFPILTLIAVPLILQTQGLERVVGLQITVLLAAGTALAVFLVALGVTNLWRPRSICIAPDGVQVDRLFGKGQTIPWGAMTLTFGRPTGFGVLRHSQPTVGFIFLTRTQYEAVSRSSHLPSPGPPPRA
jgi:hypothetical protein